MQERLFYDRLLQGLRGGATRNWPVRTVQGIYKNITRGRAPGWELGRNVSRRPTSRDAWSLCTYTMKRNKLIKWSTSSANANNRETVPTHLTVLYNYAVRTNFQRNGSQPLCNKADHIHVHRTSAFFLNIF